MNKENLIAAPTPTPRIPTRTEFHREFAGEIIASDFDTSKPNGKEAYHTYTERQFLCIHNHNKARRLQCQY